MSLNQTNLPAGSNNGWQIYPQDIIDKFVSIDWLYHRIYGDDLLNKLVYDANIDSNIHIIWEIFWYSDAKEIMQKRVDWDRFKKLSQIIFRYTELQNPWFFSQNG